MSQKKIKLSFQKGTPNFIARLKEQTGYQEPELGDKFRESSEQPQKNRQPEQKMEESSPTLDPVSKQFKPSFKLADKKQKNKAIVEMIKAKNKVPSNFKMSSQTAQQYQQRMEQQKDRILHEKTKKIMKPNKNLLSFQD